MSKDDYRIWSNADLDYEERKDWMEEEYPTLSDDERVAMMYEENGHYLEDERLNLDIQLSQPILVVADLGLWNGRRTGYKEIPSGNIRDCLYSDYDYTTWYVDKSGDLRCDDTHHDGTNHYLYRVYKDNVSQAQKDRLKEKIYNGTATRATEKLHVGDCIEAVGRLQSREYIKDLGDRGKEPRTCYELSVNQYELQKKKETA